MRLTGTPVSLGGIEEIDELPPRPPGLPPAVARPLCMSGFSTADLQGMERHEIAVARSKSNKQ